MEIDGFRGELIAADHAEYDTARAVWNGDDRPAPQGHRPVQWGR